jgi:hypothetical protein
MNTYPLTQANKDQEHAIIKKNGYQRAKEPPTYLPYTTNKTQKEKENGPHSHIMAQRLETYFVTRLKIAYKTTSTIGHHLKSGGQQGDIQAEWHISATVWTMSTKIYRTDGA